MENGNTMLDFKKVLDGPTAPPRACTGRAARVTWIAMKRRILIVSLITLGSWTLAVLSGVLGWDIQCGVTSVVYLTAGLLIGRLGRGHPWGSWPGIGVIGVYLLTYGAPSLHEKLWHIYPIWMLGTLSFLVGILLGSRSRTPRRSVLFAAAYAVVMIPGCYLLMQNWLSYVFNRGATAPSLTPAYEFRTEEGRPITPDELKGKVVVFDFWTTACGVCFEKFPEFDAFYQRHRDDAGMAIFAVNLPLDGETIEQNSQLARSLGHSVPTIFAAESFQRTRDGFGLAGFPLVVVIDRNGVTRYKGQLYAAWYIFVNNIDVIIKAIG